MPALPQLKLPVLLVSFSILFSVTPAYSAGFALIENSASGMGKAFAGAAAAAEDASTVWFNPAGMTYLGEKLNGKSQLSNSLHLISAKTKFKDKGSTPPASLGAASIDGEKNVSGNVLSPVPNLYYVRPINERLHFGLAINGPFGSKTEYDKDWIGRYHATETDMKTVNINPSLSWKANEKLSLGGGISAQYIDVKLGRSVDSAAVCRSVGIGVATKSNSTALIDHCTNTYPKASQHKNDSQVEVAGDDFSFGFNLGLLYQPTNMTRIGASYRSKVKHDLKGKVKYDLHAGLAPALGFTGNRFEDRDIRASVELPDSVSLSLAHKVNSKLEILADVTWTQWSTFQELRIVDTTGAEVTNTPEEWKDVTRVSLGANYKYNDKLTLRTGVAFDEEPIPSATLRTPRIPGNDRTWLSFGAGYKMNKKMSVDFGYSHLFLEKTAIDNTDDVGYSVKGLYDSSVDILSAQFNYTF